MRNCNLGDFEEVLFLIYVQHKFLVVDICSEFQAILNNVWLCSGRMLIASAYYKSLDSWALLFKKTRYPAVKNIKPWSTWRVMNVLLFNFISIVNTLFSKLAVEYQISCFNSLVNSSKSCKLHHHSVGLGINNVTHPVADFCLVTCFHAEAKWTIQWCDLISSKISLYFRTEVEYS